MGQYYRRDYRVSLISKMKYTLTLACLVSATLGVQLDKAIQETHPCRCTQRFQRQLFRVNKVQESGRLAEEVTDCGPAVDLKATPGCQLLKGEADPKANFPDCCPVYDCEEGVEVKYVEPPKPKKAEAPGESSE